MPLNQQDLETIEKLIEHKLREYGRQMRQEIIEDVKRTVSEGLEQIRLGQVYRTPVRPEDLPPLEGRAAEVFEQLRSITGTDADARQQAQRTLSTYSGELVTQVFTLHLKHYLKEKGWWIKCLKKGCRKPATPLWQKDIKRRLGGQFQCSHRGNKPGTATRHGGMTKFRTITLVEYRDQRLK